MRSHCWRDTRLALALGFRCRTTELAKANLLVGFGSAYHKQKVLVEQALAEVRAAQANNPYAVREKRAEDTIMRVLQREPRVGPAGMASGSDAAAAREKRAEANVIGRPTSLPTGGIGAKPAPWYDDPANKEDLDRLLQHFGINPEEKP